MWVGFYYLKCNEHKSKIGDQFDYLPQLGSIVLFPTHTVGQVRLKYIFLHLIF